MAQDAQRSSSTRHSIGRPALCVISGLVAGLSACSHAPSELAPGANDAPAPRVATMLPVPPQPSPVTPQRARSKPSAERKRSAAPTERPDPPRSAPIVEPTEVTGLTEDAMDELLGPPTHREEKPPARVWRYVGPMCEVIVAFYPDIGDLTYRALNVAVAGRSSIAERACLGELAEARRRA